MWEHLFFSWFLFVYTSLKVDPSMFAFYAALWQNISYSYETNTAEIARQKQGKCIACMHGIHLQLYIRC